MSLFTMVESCFPKSGPQTLALGDSTPICIIFNGNSRAAFNIQVDKMSSISLAGNDV